ncbi:hypothetical protein ACP70R_028645 [Stipagrostis hirtigluma subsp. patula]
MEFRRFEPVFSLAELLALGSPVPPRGLRVRVMELASLHDVEAAITFADQMRLAAGWEITNHAQLDLAHRHLRRIRLRRFYAQAALNRLDAPVQALTAEQVRDLLAVRLRAAGARAGLVLSAPHRSTGTARAAATPTAAPGSLDDSSLARADSSRRGALTRTREVGESSRGRDLPALRGSAGAGRVPAPPTSASDALDDSALARADADSSRRRVLTTSRNADDSSHHRVLARVDGSHRDRSLTGARAVDRPRARSAPRGVADPPRSTDTTPRAAATDVESAPDLLQARGGAPARARAGSARPTSLRDATAINAAAERLVETAVRAAALRDVITRIIQNFDRELGARVVLEELANDLKEREEIAAARR